MSRDKFQNDDRIDDEPTIRLEGFPDGESSRETITTALEKAGIRLDNINVRAA